MSESSYSSEDDVEVDDGRLPHLSFQEAGIDASSAVLVFLESGTSSCAMGRSHLCDVQLTNPYVSSCQFILQKVDSESGTKLQIRDLSLTNATTLDGFTLKAGCWADVVGEHTVGFEIIDETGLSHCRLGTIKVLDNNFIPTYPRIYLHGPCAMNIANQATLKATSVATISDFDYEEEVVEDDEWNCVLDSLLRG